MVVAAPALGALAAFAAMCFLVFLYYAYGYSLGAVLVALANFFRSIGFSLGWFGRISLAFIADGIESIDNSIRHALGSGIIATRAAGLYLWHYAAYAIRELGDTIADLAESTERALTRTVTVTIPRFVTHRLDWTYAHVLALEKAVAHLPARVERITVEKVHTVTRTIVHDAAVVGGGIAIPRIKPLERAVDMLEQKATALYKKLTVAGIIGLIGATIFDQFGLSWLKCRGVNRVGKSLCGLSGIIEKLALDAVDVLLVTNLCSVVTALTKGARLFAPEVSYLVSLTEGLIKCQGASRPAVLHVTTYTPPPASNLVAFTG